MENINLAVGKRSFVSYQALQKRFYSSNNGFFVSNFLLESKHVILNTVLSQEYGIISTDIFMSHCKIQRMSDNPLEKELEYIESEFYFIISSAEVASLFNVITDFTVQ